MNTIHVPPARRTHQPPIKDLPSGTMFQRRSGTVCIRTSDGGVTYLDDGTHFSRRGILDWGRPYRILDVTFISMPGGGDADA